MIIGNFNERLS